MPLIEDLEGRRLFAGYNAATAADLIAQINTTNGSPEADTITLAAGATFSLTAANNAASGATGLPVIQAGGGGLTIVGNGATIERSASPGTPAFRLLDVAPDASLTLSGLVLQGGLSRGTTGYVPVEARGGAIYSRGALILSGVTVRNNVARGGDSTLLWNYFSPAGTAAGGGIFSTGTLSATGCTFQYNLAAGGRGGDSRPYYRSMPGNGGDPTPAKPGGDASGGGIHVGGGGSAALVNSTFTANTAQGGNGGSGDVATARTRGGNGGNGSGGALYAAAGGNLTLQNVGATANNALRGLAGVSAKGKPKATPGTGSGGGLYLDAAAAAGLDVYTVANVKLNAASTGRHNDIYGPYHTLA